MRVWQRKQVNQDFFKIFSHDMAYVLGFICADGNLSENKNGSKFVSIYSKDKQLLTNIRNSMGSDHKISTRQDNCCRVQIGSKILFEDLNKIGITPNKTKRLTLPKIPKKFFPDFIRGFFDGDGNVWMGQIHKERLTRHWTIRVVFTSCSDDFLSSFNEKISEQFNIRGVLSHGKGNYYRLTFSMKGALKLYKIMYNVKHPIIHLGRKKLVFIKFMKANKGIEFFEN